ncbi:MAG TPA: hypothetical protein VKO18_20950 [Terriglobia bacterium]|nr:hypothetical protein [Terriglobia bacterium]
MTRANKSGSPAIVGEGKKGSSARIAAAGLAMLMTFLVGTARNSIARRDPEIRSGDLKMSVRVYNYAGSSADTLRLAESDAARIFAKAGVRLEWHECPFPASAESADPACAAPLAPSDLQLRIVKGVKPMRKHADAEIGGFTLGNLATVQMEPLLEAGRPTACLPYQMLGRAIAHEFGHALLGPEHSSRGIMQARWGEGQLGFAAANDLVFAPDQEKALRLAVKGRNRQ